MPGDVVLPLKVLSTPMLGDVIDNARRIKISCPGDPARLGRRTAVALMIND